VEAVLPRRSVLIRRSAGERAGPQPLVANVDVLVVAMGLDADWSVRRLERYVALAEASGVEPAVLVTKADLVGDAELSRRLADARATAPGAAVLPVSAVRGAGLEGFGAYLERRRTCAHLSRRLDPRKAREERDRWKNIATEAWERSRRKRQG